MMKRVIDHLKAPSGITRQQFVFLQLFGVFVVLVATLTAWLIS